MNFFLIFSQERGSWGLRNNFLQLKKYLERGAQKMLPAPTPSHAVKPFSTEIQHRAKLDNTRKIFLCVEPVVYKLMEWYGFLSRDFEIEWSHEATKSSSHFGKIVPEVFPLAATGVTTRSRQLGTGTKIHLGTGPAQFWTRAHSICRTSSQNQGAQAQRIFPSINVLH